MVYKKNEFEIIAIYVINICYSQENVIYHHFRRISMTRGTFLTVFLVFINSQKAIADPGLALATLSAGWEIYKTIKGDTSPGELEFRTQEIKELITKIHTAEINALAKSYFDKYNSPHNLLRNQVNLYNFIADGDYLKNLLNENLRSGPTQSFESFISWYAVMLPIQAIGHKLYKLHFGSQDSDQNIKKLFQHAYKVFSARVYRNQLLEYLKENSDFDDGTAFIRCLASRKKAPFDDLDWEYMKQNCWQYFVGYRKSKEFNLLENQKEFYRRKLGLRKSFEIRVDNSYDTLCLDYSKDSDNGNVNMRPCNGGNKQQWYWNNGKLASSHDGMCLDKNKNTNNVSMYRCHDGSNQKWYWQGATLRNLAGGCLDWTFGYGKNVQTWECHGNWNQRWKNTP